MTQLNSSLRTIMEAAEAIIQEKGCRQTTLQEIIQRSGLSKGAIYHYVASKDELFGMILLARVEQMSTAFNAAVNNPNTNGIDNPLQLIAGGMVRSSEPQDVSNKIFIYLLSQMDNPKVAAKVQEVYKFTLETCTTWIEIGKQHGVIPAQVDSARIANLLIIQLYGMRMQNVIMEQGTTMTADDLAKLMRSALQ